MEPIKLTPEQRAKAMLMTIAAKTIVRATPEQLTKLEYAMGIKMPERPK